MVEIKLPHHENTLFHILWPFYLSKKRQSLITIKVILQCLNHVIWAKCQFMLMVFKSINWQLPIILTKGLLRCFKLKLSYQTTVDCVSARYLILTNRRSRGLSISKYGGYIFGFVLVVCKSIKCCESAHLLRVYSGQIFGMLFCVQIAIPWY